MFTNAGDALRDLKSCRDHGEIPLDSAQGSLYTKESSCTRVGHRVMKFIRLWLTSAITPPSFFCGYCTCFIVKLICWRWVGWHMSYLYSWICTAILWYLKSHVTFCPKLPNSLSLIQIFLIKKKDNGGDLLKCQLRSAVFTLNIEL